MNGLVWDFLNPAMMFSLFFFVFVLRYLLACQSKVGFDESGHAYFGKLALNNKSPFKAIKLQALNAQEYRIPLLFNYLFSLFSKTDYGRLRVISLMVEAAFVCFWLYLIAAYLTSAEEAFLVMVVYLLSPISFSGFSTGPRVKTYTPRLISELLANTSILFFLVGIDQEQVVILGLWLFLAASCVSLLCLGSKFGVQFSILFYGAFFLLTAEFNALIVLVVAFLISVIVGRGYFVESCFEQCRHLKWYFTKNIKGEMAVSSRNRIVNFYHAFKAGEGVVGKLKKVFHVALVTNSYTSTIIKFPVAFMSLAMLFYIEDISVSALSSLLLVVFSIFVVINLRWFLFLGEAERYITHSMVAICLFFVLNSAGGAVYWVVFYGALYYLLEFVFTFYKSLGRAGVAAKNLDADLLDFVGRLGGTKKILLSPFHIGPGLYRFMSETQHEFVSPFGVDSSFLEVYECDFGGVYPRSKIDSLNRLHDVLGVDVLICDEDTIRYCQQFLNEDGLWFKELLSAGPNIYAFIRTPG